MLRQFVKLVDEAVEDGFIRGLNLFMENLEEDLSKAEVITEAGGVNHKLYKMFEAEGIVVDVPEEELNKYDEKKMDELLEQFKKEGIKA